jgi:hypothetical protein
MRDKRFVAEHRGGLMTQENHRLLMRWARECCQHILPLIKSGPDDRLAYALSVAREWEEGNAKTGKAMNASREAHAVARILTDPVEVAVARAIGQGVATAHMAEHSLGAALYGLMAVKLSGLSVTQEREWQYERLQQLPVDVVELVRTTMSEKGKAFINLREAFT